MSKESTNHAYSARDIEVLEGLDPVRKRPAMYIGGTDSRGFHHLLWEIVDNAVDEAINGHATQISVHIDAEGRGARVTDDGRGIPVDLHPKFNKSALEVILTTLHAGGKFAGKSYQVAGGLHGVGSSVVNALSEQMRAEVTRDGARFVQMFARGKAVGPLQKVGPARGHGTSIFFVPDPEIFGASARFDLPRIRERLEAKSYLHRGLVIALKDEKTGESWTFDHPQGILEYLQKLVEERKAEKVHAEPFFVERKADPRMELALCWTESTDEVIRTYANGIPTPMGGTHEAGLKQALSKALRAYLTQHKLLPKGLSIMAEDMREGLVAVLSVYVEDPQFQGQTKDRLNNPEVSAKVEGAARVSLEQWLHDNPTMADAVAARVVIAARARQASRAASQSISRKTAVNHRLHLPGKLSDCSSTDPDRCELFLVEGDSAGGNAKQGRDRRYQAILPLRGKVLNSERANAQQILANKELQDVVRALGCGLGKDFDRSRLRYNRIFLLMDADTDGNHIATLLLTFFFRFLPGLIRHGHVFLAQPPLYRIDAPKGEVHWAADDQERDLVLKRLGPGAKFEISRFKGLGEMTAEELRMTTLDPSMRRSMRVGVEGELEADQVISSLMGKDAGARYDFIMRHAEAATLDELDV